MLQRGAKRTSLGSNRFSDLSQSVPETAEAVRMPLFASNTQLKQGVNESYAVA
jgi:hypothetical protein